MHISVARVICGTVAMARYWLALVLFVQQTNKANSGDSYTTSVWWYANIYVNNIASVFNHGMCAIIVSAMLIST